MAVASRSSDHEPQRFALTPAVDGAGSRTAEEWISLVRVLLLLTLIPALWFRIVPLAHPALNAIILLLGGYVILLAIGPRWLAALRRADLVIVLDLFVVTLVVIVSGSLNSPFVYLYYLTILEAAGRLNLRQALAASLAMTAMIILLWIHAGHVADLESTGFRLGAFIAGGFLLALLLGILAQEYRAARERLEGLQFDNNLSARLSGELRVEGVLAILLQVYLEATQLRNGAAYLCDADGAPRLAATRGVVWGEGGLSPETLPLPVLPQGTHGGEIIIHPCPSNGDAPGNVLVCLPLVRAGELRAWLCGLGDPPISIAGSVRGRLRGVAAQGVSALDAARLHEKVQELAATDALTGLANRRSFLDRLTSELAACRRTGRPLSLALLDLNGFKAINDTYGHSVGDSALIQVAQLLTRNIRASDLAARFGGDEFVLLLPETPSEIAEKVLDRLGSTQISISDGRNQEQLKISWGIATWPQDGTELEPLLHAADGRLYAMKRPLTLRSGELVQST